MRTFFILLQKELRSYFQSMMAYIVLALFTAVNGIAFVLSLVVLMQAPSKANLLYWVFNNPFFWIVFILIFPLITMRLFSEEKRSGTIETLLTAPVGSGQVVAAKFVAAVIFYLVMYLPFLLYFALFGWVTGKPPAFGEMALCGSYLMILCMGLMFTAFGCLASAMTSHQIVAAVITFSFILGYFLLGFVETIFPNVDPRLIEFLEFISPPRHMKQFSEGLFDTRPIIYYLSVTFFFLAATHQVLEHRRWRS